jgi:GntR family transcriptional regulator, transcriptional repressor for pyruvate dehydrogenase complex
MKNRNEFLFARIEQAPNLTGGLVETLAAQIESGRLAPGQRLPTEQAIVVAT